MCNFVWENVRVERRLMDVAIIHQAAALAVFGGFAAITSAVSEFLAQQEQQSAYKLSGGLQLGRKVSREDRLLKKSQHR